MVLYAAIVPKGDGIRLPFEATVQLRRLDVAIEHLEHGGALMPGELHDAGREPAIDKQEPLARDGVCADHRMLGTREHSLVLDAVAPSEHVLAIMDRGQSFEHLADRLGKSF